VITSYSLVSRTKPALEFLSIPSIKWSKRKGLLYSKNYIDYSYNIKIEKIPFLTSFDIKLTNVTQCNIFHEKVIITTINKMF